MPYNTSQRQIQPLNSKLDKLHAHATFNEEKVVRCEFTCAENPKSLNLQSFGQVASSAQTGMAVAANARGRFPASSSDFPLDIS